MIEAHIFSRENDDNFELGSLKKVVLYEKFHNLCPIHASKITENTPTIELWHKNKLISTLVLKSRSTDLLLSREW